MFTEHSASFLLPIGYSIVFSNHPSLMCAKTFIVCFTSFLKESTRSEFGCLLLSVDYIYLVVTCYYVERYIAGFCVAAEVVWKIPNLVIPCGDYTIGITVSANIKRWEPSGVSGIQ